MWLKPLAVISFSALLAGCGTTVVTKTVCPPIATYSADFQDKLAQQIDALPGNSELAVAIVDYHQLRNVIRSCEAR